jgi:hypothetical protein
MQQAMTVDRVGSQRFPDMSQPQMGTWGKRLTECSVAVSESRDALVGSMAFSQEGANVPFGRD